MNRISALLRPLLLASAAALSACVTSPYYTPPNGSVYYVQDPWFYRNSHRDCYDVWYGCSRPYYGSSYYDGYYYGGHRPPPAYHHHPRPSRPRPPPHVEPPDDKPVYAPKPPRLIRLTEAEPKPGRTATNRMGLGRVIAPAPAAKPATPVRAAPKPQIRPEQTQPAGNRRLQQVVAPAPRAPVGRQVQSERPAAKPAPAGHARILRDRLER